MSYSELAAAVDSAVGGDHGPLVALLSGDRGDSAVLALSDVTDAADDAVRDRVVRAISVVAPRLAPTYAPFGASSWERLAIFFGKLLLRADEARTLELLNSAPAEFVVYAVRLMEAEKDPRFEQEQSAMREIATRRIVEALSRDTVWNSVAPLGMYVAVLAKWQPTRVREQMHALIAGRPERARMLLAARIQPALMSGSSSMRQIQIDVGQLEKEVDPKKLLEIIEADPGRNEEHVGVLRRAIQAAESPAGQPSPPKS